MHAGTHLILPVADSAAMLPGGELYICRPEASINTHFYNTPPTYKRQEPMSSSDKKEGLSEMKGLLSASLCSRLTTMPRQIYMIVPLWPADISSWRPFNRKEVESLRCQPGLAQPAVEGAYHLAQAIMPSSQKQPSFATKISTGT